MAKVKKGIGDQDEKNILGLSGKNNVLKNSSLPSSQNEENVYFQVIMTTLVRLIMTGNIVAVKNKGGYKYGGIAEKPPNLTHHFFTCNII